MSAATTNTTITNKAIDKEWQIRAAAFRWLSEQTKMRGDYLPRQLLQKGFPYAGQRIPLVSACGIFKPAVLELPLSITTSPKSPYDDRLENAADEPDFIIYKYRQHGGPYHRDNVGLRKVLEQQLPLIYFFGVIPGIYIPAWPAYIVADDIAKRQFKVMIAEDSLVKEKDTYKSMVSETADLANSYATAKIKVRLHQRKFRETVLAAYRWQCAFCQLRLTELLDASHIIPDSEPQSRPTVNNGISLCKLHHAAFDNYMIAVTPDFRIQVRTDVLEETDGPMLQHGLKEIHQTKIILPASRPARPDRDALEWRFEKFMQRQPER